MIFFLFLVAFALIFYGIFENFKKSNDLKLGEYPEKSNIDKLLFHSFSFFNKNIIFTLFVFVILIILIYLSLKFYDIGGEVSYYLTGYFTIGFIITIFFSYVLFLLPILLLKLNYPHSKIANNEAFIAKNSIYFSFLLMSVFLFLVYIILNFSGGASIDYLTEVSKKTIFIWSGSGAAIFILFIAINFSKTLENIENPFICDFLSSLVSFLWISVVYFLSIMFLFLTFYVFSQISHYIENFWIYVFIAPIFFILSFLIAFIYYEKYGKIFELEKIFKVFGISIVLYVLIIIFMSWYLFKSNMWFFVSFASGILCFLSLIHTEKFISMNLKNFSHEKLLRFTLFHLLIVFFSLILSYYSGVKALSPFYESFFSGMVGVFIFIIAVISLSFYSFFLFLLKNSYSCITLFSNFSSNKFSLPHLTSFDFLFFQHSFLYAFLFGMGSILSSLVLKVRLHSLYLEFLFAILVGIIFFIALLWWGIYFLDRHLQKKFETEIISGGFFSPFLFLLSFFVLLGGISVVLKTIFAYSFSMLSVSFFTFLVLAIISIAIIEIFLKGEKSDSIKTLYYEKVKTMFFYIVIFLSSFFVIIKHFDGEKCLLLRRF